MTFKEFILIKYDIRERVKLLRSDPLKDFLASDIFPCDFVAVENGERIKMLYYADGGKEIAVLDLLSYKREDIIKLKDEDLVELYDTYTSQFEFDSESLTSLSKLTEMRTTLLGKSGLHK